MNFGPKCEVMFNTWCEVCTVNAQLSVLSYWSFLFFPNRIPPHLNVCSFISFNNWWCKASFPNWFLKSLDDTHLRSSLLRFSLESRWVYRLFWGELTSWDIGSFLDKHDLLLILFVPIMKKHNSVPFHRISLSWGESSLKKLSTHSYIQSNVHFFLSPLILVSSWFPFLDQKIPSPKRILKNQKLALGFSGLSIGTSTSYSWLTIY